MDISEKDLAKAQETFDNLCAMLNEDDWKYSKEEDLVVRFSAQGDDIPMDFIIVVDPNPGLVCLYSMLPFNIADEKIVDAAIAACAINSRLKNGSFDLDISDGSIKFRLAQAYFDSAIGKEVFQYMVYVSAHTVDEYNDKFMMLSKGALSINDFLATLN